MNNWPNSSRKKTAVNSNKSFKGILLKAPSKAQMDSMVDLVNTGEIEVKPLPALVNGFITVGWFNFRTKLNDAVLALWAKVLNAFPSAK